MYRKVDKIYKDLLFIFTCLSYKFWGEAGKIFDMGCTYMYEGVPVVLQLACRCNSAPKSLLATENRNPNLIRFLVINILTCLKSYFNTSMGFQFELVITSNLNNDIWCHA